jgi:hypothetical protein
MTHYEHYDKSKFHTFIAILAGLGVFVTFMFYYNVVELQQQQQELAAIQEFGRINDTVLNSVLDSINLSSTIIPSFVLSITPLTNTICCPGGSGGSGGSGSMCIYTPATDPVTPQTCTEKMVLSYRIFALWQDTIISKHFVGGNQTGYIANFLQRANSPQLYEQWLVNRLNFVPDTQTLGDLLFEYGLPITDQVPSSYINAANQLVNNPRYQQIFK